MEACAEGGDGGELGDGEGGGGEGGEGECGGGGGARGEGEAEVGGEEGGCEVVAVVEAGGVVEEGVEQEGRPLPREAQGPAESRKSRLVYVKEGCRFCRSRMALQRECRKDGAHPAARNAATPEAASVMVRALKTRRGPRRSAQRTI